MSVGYGVGGGVGIGKESTPGTAVAPSLWLPFSSESIAVQRQVGEDSTIYGDRSIKVRNYGMINGQGNFDLAVDGSTIGLPLALWNGNAQGAYTRAAVAGYLTAAASATPSVGGTLAEGVYRYRVASVWKTPSGALYYLPQNAEVTATTTSENKKVGLSWSAPEGVIPSGFTAAGYLVFRSEVDGAANTTLAIAYVAEGTSYDDDGSKAQVASAAPYTAAIQQHSFVKSFVPGSNPLPSFTTTLVKDNDKSERFPLCRMNEWSLTLGDGNSPVTASFGIMGARKPTLVTNPSISHTVLRKFMGWASEVNIDGEWEPLAEGFSLQCSNNTALVPGFRNKNDYRDVGYGSRTITGTLNRGFEDHKFWSKMVNGCTFDLRAFLTGQHLVEGCWALIDGMEMYAFPYCMLVDVFECSVTGAGASVGGPDRLVEAVAFGAGTSVSAGTDMKISLFNVTASDYV
ncbi:MAG: phage tail tube protein [Vulcanimicrobiota bacterium]